ncbi:MAG TPA: LLM class flavin-dependent oxidoreductase [Rhodanobacteraceae bacterium]|nr:LLM class flavin-dependent oxidoreductase [Rhodanobacteraceae bacterium]
MHLSANVANLPLRQPAVLARAAASLDLLSGGRFELALGAGGFWDAIEAMGGRRLTPGQSVDALSEAIDVIRGIWDPGERARFEVEGEFYRVSGAKRGPAPAHDLPIWIGAYRPRMLRLIGRKGDGWLPTLGRMTRAEFAAANATIDEAALAAGLANAGRPAPDLFIRTGGEHRVSNFLLWQLAYTELYFTDTLWPDMDAAELDRALDDYSHRERRFGCVPAPAPAARAS